MTTHLDQTAPPRPISSLLDQAEDALSLLEPRYLHLRLQLLDSLDASFGDMDDNPLIPKEMASLIRRSNTLRGRLEAANRQLYETLRTQIAQQTQPCPLLTWIQSLSDAIPDFPGPSFDYRDDLVSGVLSLREPHSISTQQEPEMVFYQPTPVRHILDLIRLTHLRANDVLVDLGAGLGHVALLASLLTGVESIGIEIEPAYVASAQECAERLQQSRVRFLHSDARAADLSRGTVFYLYTPFTGSILAEVLETLRHESRRRPIRICTLGPCTDAVARVPWLQAATTPDPGRITLFYPCS